MNYDELSHVGARTHRAGIQQRVQQRSGIKGKKGTSGPQAICGCGRRVYATGMVGGKCLECRLTGGNR